ncbi:MAG TPA: BON domain-containing protein [Candidatus Acidoferrales bacterium]|nr:BON domain-containing protein [Candidatus Acidoferrales bacterium]
MKKTAALTLLFSLLAATGAASSADDAQSKTSVALAHAKDDLIVAAVKARLLAADLDTATDVSVSSHGGAVVLSGVVRRPDEIRRLSDAAAGVSGVHSVETHLTVNPSIRPATQQISDAALATEVVARLAAQTGINAFSVKTSVHDGHVTLTGGVHSRSVKSLLIATAKSTSGVKSVEDHITVNQ